MELTNNPRKRGRPPTNNGLRPLGREWAVRNGFDIRKLDKNLGLAKIPPILEDYIKSATAFAYMVCLGYIQKIGPVSPSVSAIIQSAALQLASSRALFAAGEDMMTASKLADAASKNLTLAYNLAREEAGLALTGGGKRPDWIEQSRKFFSLDQTDVGQSNRPEEPDDSQAGQSIDLSEQEDENEHQPCMLATCSVCNVFTDNGAAGQDSAEENGQG